MRYFKYLLTRGLGYFLCTSICIVMPIMLAMLDGQIVLWNRVFILWGIWLIPTAIHIWFYRKWLKEQTNE